mmetsp:Transcript_100077/g.173743  ORF Transcript_100077/g.173743 Transcript_100077/m.173743 type:complete len:287 (-) Transcript_100077:1103-1963(-)
MLPSVWAAFCRTSTFDSVASRLIIGGTTPSSKHSNTFSSCSVSNGKAPTALKRINGDSRDIKSISGFKPPSCRTVCWTVSSCERFQITPAAFSTTVGYSESISGMSRPIAPACDIANLFSCVSAKDTRVPKQFSTAGMNLEDSKTPSKNGMPPAFRIMDFMLSTADKFQRALAAFSCRTSSVGSPMHWMSALTPPAALIATALSSSTPKFVSVIAVTARSINGKLGFRRGTSLEMPDCVLMTTLHSFSTARLRIAPAAASRQSSGVSGSSSRSSNPTPSSSRMCVR